MIYIFTALYQEAKPFIEYFRLKKETRNKSFQEFWDLEKEICLVVTGVGSIPSAVAVGCVCTQYGVGEEDLLINIGTCASSCNKGTLFLGNKITDESFGRTFYPDILYKHDFCEGRIITLGKPVSGGLPDMPAEHESVLYDMEGAAVYQAGSYFFGPHRMSFLKVVSDNGDGETVTPKQVEELMGRCAPPIIQYVRKLQEIILVEKSQKSNLKAHTMQLIEKVCEDLCCSKTMEASVWQHFRYLLLTGVDVETIIAGWYEEEKLPCQNRREGKKRFEEFKEGLF